MSQASEARNYGNSGIIIIITSIVTNDSEPRSSTIT
jgi:hypothetical protein